MFLELFMFVEGSTCNPLTYDVYKLMFVVTGRPCQWPLLHNLDLTHIVWDRKTQRFKRFQLKRPTRLKCPKKSFVG